jgi:hypothetical protein
MNKGVKRLHPALIAIGVGFMLLILMRLLPISISIESSPPDPLPGTAFSPPPVKASPTTPPLAIAQASNPVSEGTTGSFRVSNQTSHPIRVALLSQQPAGEAKTYAQPAHWDFAPEEGREKGLLLSLPEKQLQLKPGDILVAFAQDGSQRYWGPYVVGTTDAPRWKANGAEWWLVLRP